jgi:hypothetical protein
LFVKGNFDLNIIVTEMNDFPHKILARKREREREREREATIRWA